MGREWLNMAPNWFQMSDQWLTFLPQKKTNLLHLGKWTLKGVLLDFTLISYFFSFYKNITIGKPTVCISRKLEKVSY